MAIHFQTQWQKALTAHRAGDFAQAKLLYQEILSKEKEPQALYNLGLLLLAEKNIADAKNYLAELAALHPEHFGANYYLANCYFSLEEFAEAQKYYEKALEIQPGNADALNNLGALLLHEENLEQALQCFSSAIAFKPEHTEARNNLGALLSKLGRYQHAAAHFYWILQKNPEDLHAHYNYALALLDSGDFLKAIAVFENLLLKNPENIAAQNNLGIAYLKSGEKKRASEIFAQTIAEQKNKGEKVSPEIQYLYAALTGEQPPETAPGEYIQNLFDHYAQNYDQHMTHELSYETPQKIRELYLNYDPKPQKKLNILDLGCGTGLSGLAFYDLAESLTGVDLSKKMLQHARNKNIYDKLYQDDILNFLNTHDKNSYDLIVAADVLNYFGELKNLFSAIFKALNRQGGFLFSLEGLDEQHREMAWKLMPSGRYAHHKDYIMSIATQCGFQIIKLEHIILRKENHGTVEGFACLLMR